MELEDQCTNLELSKRLKELGVKQESLFFWTDHYLTQRGEWRISNYFINSYYDRDDYAAFTVAELGNILPSFIGMTSACSSPTPIVMNKVENQYQVSILNSNNTRIPLFYSENEADARSMMLIYLIENNLVDQGWRNRWIITT